MISSALTAVFFALSVMLLIFAGYLAVSNRNARALKQLFQAVPSAVREVRDRSAMKRDLLGLLIQGKYARRIDSWIARLSDEQQARTEFRRFKYAALLISPILLLIALPDSVLLLVLSIFVFFVPDLLLYNKVEKQKIAVRNAIPETVELLSLCVDAGLTLPSALKRVGTMQGGVMGAELARLLQQVRLGVTPAAAFQALAERTGEDQIYRLVNALNQVERLGAPISMVLKEQGSEFREIRRARARENAQKVPVKILAPIMLCFLPALMIIVLAPAVIGIIRVFSGS